MPLPNDICQGDGIFDAYNLTIREANVMLEMYVSRIESVFSLDNIS